MSSQSPDLQSGTRSNEENNLSGYLYKKTKDGRWQRRWFETNGIYLTYYKTRKVEKLLAALSLPQVGEIKIEPGDAGMFSIELNTRVYMLRAKSDDEAQLWVETLSKLRAQGLVTAAKAAATSSPATTSLSSNKATNINSWEKKPVRKHWCC